MQVPDMLYQLQDEENVFHLCHSGRKLAGAIWLNSHTLRSALHFQEFSGMW
jgi:hypothetical protein